MSRKKHRKKTFGRATAKDKAMAAGTGTSNYAAQQTADLEALTGSSHLLLIARNDDGELNPIYNRTTPQHVRLDPNQPPIIVYPLMQFGEAGMVQAWYSLRAHPTREHWMCRVVQTYDPVVGKEGKDVEFVEGDFYAMWLGQQGLVKPFLDENGEVVRFSSATTAWDAICDNVYRPAKYLLIERLEIIDPETSIMYTMAAFATGSSTDFQLRNRSSSRTGTMTGLAASYSLEAICRFRARLNVRLKCRRESGPRCRTEV